MIFSVNRFFKIVSVAVTATLLSSSVCYGWGSLGHATVAEIAQRHLTPKAKANIEKYTKGQPLATWGIFLDKVRDEEPYKTAFAGWHAAIATPECKSTPEIREQYRQSRDGVSATTGMRQLLKNYKELDDSVVLVNIKALIHVIGDFHCPAHVRFTDYSNSCKFSITYYGKKTTLHKVWDTSVLTHSHKGMKYKEYAAYLDTYSKKQIRKVTAGDEQNWFEDAARCIRPICKRVKKGDAVGDDFQKYALPVAETELTKAGYQLAKVLNDIFGK